jgi:hypothetical protein
MRLISAAAGVLLVMSASGSEAKRLDEIETKASSRPPKDLWLISQKTDGGMNYTVCVSHGAVKFVTGNLAVIAKEPDWNVSLLNEKTKLFWQMPLADFNGLAPVENFDLKHLERSARENSETASGKLKIAKRVVEKFEGKPEYSAEKARKMGFTPAKVMVWTCSDIPADPKALEVLSRLYGTSGIKGIPMQVQMETESGEKIDCLKTEWCFDRNLSPLFFDVTKQFRKAKSQADLMAKLDTHTARRELKPHEPVSSHLKELIKGKDVKTK